MRPISPRPCFLLGILFRDGLDLKGPVGDNPSGHPLLKPMFDVALEGFRPIPPPVGNVLARFAAVLTAHDGLAAVLALMRARAESRSRDRAHAIVHRDSPFDACPPRLFRDGSSTFACIVVRIVAATNFGKNRFGMGQE